MSNIDSHTSTTPTTWRDRLLQALLPHDAARRWRLVAQHIAALVACLCLIPSAAIACAGLGAPPKLEQVDFKDAQAISVDHEHNTKGEGPFEIKDVGAKNEVEWQQSTTAGSTKNWPVVYVRKTKPKIVAQFALEKPTEEFIKNQLEGNATITGEGMIGTTPFKGKTELTKAELEANKGLFVTKEFETETELPNKVALFEGATLTWKWKLKEKGQPAVEQELGKSSHNFYMTNTKALGGITNYLTLLDLATKGIEKEAVAQPPSEAEIIKGIWSEIKTRKIGMRWYDVEPGTIHRGGLTLEYYEENNTVNKTLKEVEEANIETCSIEAVEGLLRQAEGKCGAWALAFSYALAEEGISSTVQQVQAKFGAAGEKCEAVGSCNMLIKEWEFVGAGKGGKFPWDANEVKDLAGIAGQGTSNPPSVFGNHYIIETKKGSNKLYDPSYGMGPYEGAEPLKEFQEKSVAGFCGPFDKETSETECQKAPAALQVVKSEALKFE